jgi:hypothetical protein
LLEGLEAIAIYDDVLSRAATELPLHEIVARALVNKGLLVGRRGRKDKAITIYADLLGRFGLASEVPLIRLVELALENRTITAKGLLPGVTPQHMSVILPG